MAKRGWGSITRRRRGKGKPLLPGFWVRYREGGDRKWKFGGMTVKEAEAVLARLRLEVEGRAGAENPDPDGPPESPPPAPEPPAPPSPPVPPPAPPAPPVPDPAPAPTKTGPTVAALVAAFLDHARGYYLKGGMETSEVGLLDLSTRVLVKVYGTLPAADFGPVKLEDVQSILVSHELTRTTINHYTGRIKRIFRWGVRKELIAPSVWHGLTTVPGLRAGRSAAREPERIKPVPDPDVEAILPLVSRQVAAMARVARLTGARPGEVVILRAADIDRSGKVWEYRPMTHKTEHRGQDRVIAIGPQAQLILRPWIEAHPSGFLFSPAEAEEERNAGRVTGLWNFDRRRAENRARPPAERYTVGTYRKAIARACKRAAVPNWSPNRLRHNAGTKIRKEYGLDVAQAVLGHRDPKTTLIYAEADRGRARKAMEEAG